MLVLKRNLVLCLLCSICFCVSAKKGEIFTVKQGDPLILLQEKKTATFEIDYSQMMVTDSKDHDNDMNFREWMVAQDEDDDEWTKDWEDKDSAACQKAFRENFNDEVKKGIRLTKQGKDYNVVLRLTMIDFGPSVKYSWRGLHGGEAIASGELEVRDKTTDEVLLVLEFTDLKGDSSFKQIGRLKGIFENLGEELSEFLKEYKKTQKKKK